MLRIVKVRIKDKNNIKENLIDLCSYDEDMNGNNGKEFTWEEAIKKGYDNTAEYLADKAIKENKNLNIEKIFNDFLAWWINGDNYYKDYEIKTLEEKENIYIAIKIDENK